MVIYVTSVSYKWRLFVKKISCSSHKTAFFHGYAQVDRRAIHIIYEYSKQTTKIKRLNLF